jgi:glycosyltransferase involved in cell wall biosynthesis
MEQSLPLVTVVGLCYNHSRYVIETLESIKQQTYPNLEVILIDDFSKDDSVTVVEQWLKEKQLNWKFIKHSSNKGVTKSLNESLDLAKGKYYKAVACDDVLLPEFITTMVSQFEELTNEYALIYSDVITINDQSEVFGQTPFAERGWDTEEEVPSGKLFDQLAGWCFIPAVGTFMRTKVIKEIKFDEKLMVEDWDMWLEISKRYLIKGILPAMGKYRIHNLSLYQQKSAAYRDHELRTLEKHLGFSKAADEGINNFIYKQSILLYMHNGNRPLHWLWKRFMIKKTFSNFLHVLLAAFNISYKQKEKWLKQM